MVIATQADPPLPLARLHALGQLTELPAADLRFTADEVTTFLTRAMGVTLAADDSTALEACIEGWFLSMPMIPAAPWHIWHSALTNLNDEAPRIRAALTLS